MRGASPANDAYAAPGPASSCRRSRAVQAVGVVLQRASTSFHEGSAQLGGALHRADLTGRSDPGSRVCLHAWLPGEGEVAVLLRLMLLTVRGGRQDGDRRVIVPLAEQRRELWAQPDRRGRGAGPRVSAQANRVVPAAGGDRRGATTRLRPAGETTAAYPPSPGC